MRIAQEEIFGPVLTVIPALPPAAVTPAPAAPNTWAVDGAHSSAGFAVKHLMVSTVRGTLGPVTGSIVWDGKTAQSIKADVTIDVKKLNTGIEQRDNHLRSDDFFNAEKFPAITFKSKRVIPGAGGAFKLVGDLTIRDVTKEVTLDCEAGSFTALIGPSGCGKSTMLRLALGLDTADSGTAEIGGLAPRAAASTGTTGVAFQDAALLPWRSVEANSPRRWRSAWQESTRLAMRRRYAARSPVAVRRDWRIDSQRETTLRPACAWRPATAWGSRSSAAPA